MIILERRLRTRIGGWRNRPPTKSQNAFSREYIDMYKHRDEIKCMLAKLWDHPRSTEPFKEGEWYYQFKNSGLQNQDILYVIYDMSREPEEFFNPNNYSDDGSVSLSLIEFSKDGKHFAFGLSKSGSDWIEIRTRDVDKLEGNKDHEEVLKKVKYTSVAWTHDNKGFFYSGYLDKPAENNDVKSDPCSKQKLYYHLLHCPQFMDIEVVELEDPELRMSAVVSYCGNFVIVSAVKGCRGNMVYYSRITPDQVVSEKLALTQLVSDLNHDFEFITNDGDCFYFLTNKGAPNYRIIAVDITKPAESMWRTIVDGNPKSTLVSAKAVWHNLLVLCYLVECTHVLYLHNLMTGERYCALPRAEKGTVTGISGKRTQNEVFYTYTSFTCSSIIYRILLKTSDPKSFLSYKWHVNKISLSNYLSKDYTVEQVFYKARDRKTQIPMFIIKKPDTKLDGKRPCVLYGYGGFNISITPTFNISRLMFVTQFDGIYAIANIRGGGEYGDEWHSAGKLKNKQNCFDDFDLAGKYLIDNNYTCPEKLIIQGGSNGGLLVAACMNQNPELFAAVICEVGVLDMLRYHKFTIGYAWKTEYGCADQSREEFKVLYPYSPLHNVRLNIQYPATLLLTADHDDRVVPSHSYKFIAALQHRVGNMPEQKHPLMLRVDTEAGHGAGKPIQKIINDAVDIYSFLAKVLKLDFLNSVL